MPTFASRGDSSRRALRTIHLIGLSNGERRRSYAVFPASLHHEPAAYATIADTDVKEVRRHRYLSVLYGIPKDPPFVYQPASTVGADEIVEKVPQGAGDIPSEKLSTGTPIGHRHEVAVSSRLNLRSSPLLIRRAIFLTAMRTLLGSRHKQRSDSSSTSLIRIVG